MDVTYQEYYEEDFKDVEIKTEPLQEDYDTDVEQMITILKCQDTKPLNESKIEIKQMLPEDPDPEKQKERHMTSPTEKKSNKYTFKKFNSLFNRNVWLVNKPENGPTNYTQKLLNAEVFIHVSKTRVPMFRCSDCDYETNRESYLGVHLIEHMEMCSPKCPFCEYVASNKKFLKDHMLGHYGVQLFRCSLCCKNGYCKFHCMNQSQVMNHYECDTCK